MDNGLSGKAHIPLKRRVFRPAAATSTAIVALMVIASPAAAQPDTQWEMTAMGGWLSVRSEVETVGGRGVTYYDKWFDAGVASVGLGRWLTPHLKLDVEFAASGTGTQFLQVQAPPVNGVVVFPNGAEASTSVRSVGGSVTWQFFDNAWVHPFLFTGVSVDNSRRSLRIYEQRALNGDPRVPGSTVVVTPERREGPETFATVGGFAGGGIKLYVAERAFIRTDGRMTLSRDRQAVSVRVGAGFEF